MSNSYRRYEVLLPRKFNDGKPVPDALVGRTLRELRREFGAVSSETQTIRGSWEHRGKTYRDDLIRVFVDVEDTPRNRAIFNQLKKQLKRRFKQIDIWMTTYPIEVI